MLTTSMDTYCSTPCIQKYLGSCVVACAHCNVNWYSQLEIWKWCQAVSHKLVVDTDIDAVSYSID